MLFHLSLYVAVYLVVLVLSVWIYFCVFARFFLSGYGKFYFVYLSTCLASEDVET